MSDIERPVLDPNRTNAPAANTAAVVIIAGEPRRHTLICGLQWSYNAAPTGGALTVVQGGNTIWQVDIPTSGVGFIPSDETLKWKCPNEGQAVTVTLAAGGAAVTGKLNVQAVYD
jgi:hypothetical protein